MPVLRLPLDPNGTVGPIELPTGQRHRIVLVEAKIVRVRLIGMFFDLNKCFLLPSAMNGVRKVRSVYDEHPGAQLLVVGHTDTSGSAKFNDELALERSRSVVAYLTEDVNAWMRYYTDKVAPAKRWGIREDGLMLSVLPEDGDSYMAREEGHREAIRSFQQDHGLKVDGIAGQDTHRALVTDYMRLTDTTLPKGTSLISHGCGENFPDIPTGDDVREPRNRRVEIFVFDEPIEPAPSSTHSEAGSPEYPAWVARVSDTIDFSPDGDERVLVILDDPFLGILANLAVQAKYASGLTEQLETDDHGMVAVLLAQGDYVDLEFDTSLRNHILRVFPDPEPCSTPSGGWQRLANLGYVGDAAPLATPPDDMALLVAVSEFQAAHGIAPTGELDDATCSAIDEAHASAVPWSEQPEHDLPDDKLEHSGSLPKDAIS
jgi:outer membrane protein OmpA-like peptidoglycan-associated protein